MIHAYVGSSSGSVGRIAALESCVPRTVTAERRDPRGTHALLWVTHPSHETSAGGSLGASPLPFARMELTPGPAALTVTRGGFGGRPIYVRAWHDGALASTDLGWMVRASRALDLPVTLDADALAARSVHLPVHDERSLYREISEVPPGTRAGVVPGGLSFSRLQPGRTGSAHAEPAELHALLSRAVGTCLDHGAPVGVLTGGGLDSSALLVMARALGADANALAIDFGGEQGDRPYLSLLADALALSPCRVAPGEEAFALGAEVAGLPLLWPSGALEATLLQRASMRGAKVALSGAFADACFDGDPEAASRVLGRDGLLRAVAFARAYDGGSLRAGARRAIWPHVRGRVPSRVMRLLRAVARRAGGPSTRVFDGPRRRRAREDAWERSRGERAPIEHAPELRVAQAFFSRELGLLAELRAQEEALSGVERRDPYLHVDLVTFALSLSPEVLLGQGPRGGERRGMFREALRGVLPEAIRTRPDKASFAPLHAELLRSRARDARAMRFTALADLGIVDANAARSSIEATEHGEGGHHGELLSLLALETWLLGAAT